MSQSHFKTRDLKTANGHLMPMHSCVTDSDPCCLGMDSPALQASLCWSGNTLGRVGWCCTGQTTGHG